MVAARHKPVFDFKLRVRQRVIATRVGGVGLLDITPAVAGFGANMVREQIAPFRIHFKVRIGITAGPHDPFQFAAATIAKPARQQFALGIVSGLALVRFTLLAQRLDPVGDGIVFAISNGFTHSTKIWHKTSLIPLSEALRSPLKANMEHWSNDVSGIAILHDSNTPILMPLWVGESRAASFR